MTVLNTPNLPDQFKIHKDSIGWWVVSERRKNVKKRLFRSDVVTWEYKALNTFGNPPVVLENMPRLTKHGGVPVEFVTKEGAITWLKEIVKKRKEDADQIKEGIEFFYNESDLLCNGGDYFGIGSGDFGKGSSDFDKGSDYFGIGSDYF